MEFWSTCRCSLESKEQKGKRFWTCWDTAGMEVLTKARIERNHATSRFKRIAARTIRAQWDKLRDKTKISIPLSFWSSITSLKIGKHLEDVEDAYNKDATFGTPNNVCEIGPVSPQPAPSNHETCMVNETISMHRSPTGFSSVTCPFQHLHFCLARLDRPDIRNKTFADDILVYTGETSREMITSWIQPGWTVLKTGVKLMTCLLTQRRPRHCS